MGTQINQVAGGLIASHDLVAQVEALPVDVARHVLFKVGDALGVDGGHFVAALLAAVDRADIHNRNKLAVMFPEYVSGWLAAKDEAGLEMLRQLVKAIDAHALGVALSKAGL